MSTADLTIRARRPVRGCPIAPENPAAGSGLAATWHAADVRRGIVMATLVGLSLVVFFLGVAHYSAEQALRIECARAADYGGFRGQDKDAAVDFCVEFHKEFTARNSLRGN